MIGLAVKADLSRHGFEVVGPFLRIAPALAAADPAKTKADLALVDIDLQHGDSGIDLAHALKERGVPALFMTGQIDQAKGAPDAALGALGKPFRIPVLLEAVEAAIGYAGGGGVPASGRQLRWFGRG